MGGGMGGGPPGGGPPGGGGPGRGAPASPGEQAPPQGEDPVLQRLAPMHAALQLEVTEAAVALASTGSGAVLFVPFAPTEVELEGRRLQATRKSDRVIVDVVDAQGAHQQVLYLNERADGGALLAVARSVAQDGTPGKPLFERRYERAPAR